MHRSGVDLILQHVHKLEECNSQYHVDSNTTKLRLSLYQNMTVLQWLCSSLLTWYYVPFGFKQCNNRKKNVSSFFRLKYFSGKIRYNNSLH